MRIIQRNALNSVAKAVVSGIRIVKANAPTALSMDYVHQWIMLLKYNLHEVRYIITLRYISDKHFLI